MSDNNTPIRPRHSSPILFTIRYSTGGSEGQSPPKKPLPKVDYPTTKVVRKISFTDET